METRTDMIRYPALIDGEKGAYGLSFPDILGVVSMGASMDETLLNSREALLDYVNEAINPRGSI